MAKPKCKLPTRYDDDYNVIPFEKCGTHRGVTLCVGDRVSRLPVKEGKKTHTFPHKGTVMGVEMGHDNSGKKKMPAARVCYDNEKAGDTPYSYLFAELKKL